MAGSWTAKAPAFDWHPNHAAPLELSCSGEPTGELSHFISAGWTWLGPMGRALATRHPRRRHQWSQSWQRNWILLATIHKRGSEPLFVWLVTLDLPAMGDPIRQLSSLNHVKVAVHGGFTLRQPVKGALVQMTPVHLFWEACPRPPEDPRHAAERLHLSTDLGTPWNPPRGDGGSGQREGSLDVFAKTTTPKTRTSQSKWIDGCRAVQVSL